MPYTDLVLEGGGVKASALIGALAALEAAPEPYQFRRVAGTSAGAIVGAFLAAGMSPAQIRSELDQLDFSRFQDSSSCLGRLPWIGAGLDVLLHQGIYSGEFLYEWVKEILARRGVHTWADLAEADPHSSLPPEQRYRLVVVISDVSRGLMLRLPWDYWELLGVDPARQPVADAIRASASIPFFFRPWKLSMDPKLMGRDHIVCADGGILSNYPIALFDRSDSLPARWPTIGIRLAAHRELRDTQFHPDNTSFELAKAILSTMVSAHDRVHINSADAIRRTIFVDTEDISATDFGMGQAGKDLLYRAGLAAGQKYLRRAHP